MHANLLGSLKLLNVFELREVWAQKRKFFVEIVGISVTCNTRQLKQFKFTLTNILWTKSFACTKV